MDDDIIEVELSQGCEEYLLQHGIRLNLDNSHIRQAEVEGPFELIGGLATDRGLSLGAFTYSWSRIGYSVVSVGRYCSIAGQVTFGELEHPTNWISTSSFTYESEWFWGEFAARNGQQVSAMHLDYDRLSPRIIIGNDVWIGLGAYIRGGVTLGDGCIIGAQAVVTKDVPPYAVVIGNPGRIIKYRFPEDVIDRLLRVNWWNYAYYDLDMSRLDDVTAVLDDLEGKIDRGDISPYKPQRLRLLGSN